MCFDDDESGPSPTRPLQRGRDGQRERERKRSGKKGKHGVESHRQQTEERREGEHGLLQKMSVRVFCLLPLKAGTVSTVLGEVR